MSRALVWLPSARNDLADLWDYYSENAGEQPAAKLLQRIVHSAESLIDFPNIGHRSENDDVLEWHMPDTNYTLPYIVTADQIQGLRVFHEAQNKPSNWEASKNK